MFCLKGYQKHKNTFQYNLKNNHSHYEKEVQQYTIPP